MNKSRIALFIIGILFLTAMYAACGSAEGGGDGDYACSYETRSTDGCDGYGFGDWEEECFSFNADDYFITPQEVCDNVTTGGVFCEAGCCVDFEFRNVSLDSGFCS
jgi:hypothetical protein